MGAGEGGVSHEERKTVMERGDTGCFRCAGGMGMILFFFWVGPPKMGLSEGQRGGAGGG